MFRNYPTNRIFTLQNTLKRLNSKNTDSRCKSPYQLFQQRYDNYQQSSIFPAFLGLSTLTIVAAGLTYHYNEDTREFLRPYISKKTKMFLDEYLGPHNTVRFKRRWNEMQFSEYLPAIFSSPTTSQKDELKIDTKPIATESKSTAKVPLSNKESVQNNIQKEEDRINKLNEDLSNKLSNQVSELEAVSTSVVLHLMEFENKIQQHNEKLRQAIEDDGTTNSHAWEEVSATMNQQQNAKSLADEEMRKLDSIISHMQTIIDESLKSKDLKANPSIVTGRKVISDTRYRVQQKQAGIEKVQFTAQITNQYKELIQQGRERFKQELASLSPSVGNWTKKRTDKLSTEDLNAMIMYAHRRIHQLQAKIAELESMEVLRLESALSEQSNRLDDMTNEKVERELERERFKLSVQKQADIQEISRAHEQELRRSLTRQASAHNEHVNQLLRIQRDETERQHDLAVREALLREREHMRAAIEGWRSRVEGLEAAVEGRADEELVSREAQDMWVACHSLHNVLTGSSVTPPLARYLASFEDAVQPASLPTVRLFLAAIPPCAIKEGVSTQQLLAKRFTEKVKPTCQRVAMIDETSAPLIMYFVSWVRSLFLVTPACLIEADTLVDPENDVFDTHLIIASAELAIQKQDIDLAIRLMNLLKGMPRSVAQDWIVDARIYLETKLASEALNSYTSSKTAGSIPPFQSKPFDQ